MNPPRVIELVEYQRTSVSKDTLSAEEGELLWRQYGKQIAVEFPSPKTDGQWQLTSLGYVGFIPLSRELGLSLKPRVELRNVFRMLEYAYSLKGLKFFDDLQGLESLSEFYERLAKVLARRTLDRARRGLYRAYLPRTESLSYVRGSFDLMRRLSRPWEVRLECDFQEHTQDVEENQILAWTLHKVARSGACTERVLPSVRRAYRTLASSVAVQPFSPQTCVDRLYNRLNDDYQPLHALCRFFLEHTGPSLDSGEHQMLPFIIPMPRLFELFLAEWLRSHLPTELGIRAQEKVRIGRHSELTFQIDLVIHDTRTGEVLCVLDSKYKTDEKPSESDVQQIVAYAVSRDCNSGFLVYPRRLKERLSEKVGEIRVQTIDFSLRGDLEVQGQAFLERLMSALPEPIVA